MKEILKNIAAFALLSYMVLFILVNVQTNADALAGAVALTAGLAGGLLWVRHRYGKVS